MTKCISFTQTIINTKFTYKDIVVFSAGDTSSEKNPHNIPLGNRTPISILSPLTWHPAFSVYSSNPHENPDNPLLSILLRNSKYLRHDYLFKNWANKMDKNEYFEQSNNNSTPTSSLLANRHTHITENSSSQELIRSQGKCSKYTNSNSIPCHHRDPHYR